MKSIVHLIDWFPKTGKSSERVVTFTVFHKSDKSEVKYRKVGGIEYTAEAKVIKFEDKDYETHIHRAVLIGLESGQTYGWFLHRLN